MELMDKYYDRDKIKLTKAEEIVFEIMNDFTDRRGLRQEWDNIDDDIKEEIIQKWIDITDSKLKLPENRIELSGFGPILIETDINDMYKDIKKILSIHGNVVVSFKGIIALQTIVAKEVFGKLYKELGNVNYNTMVKIVDITKTNAMVINEGILSALKNEEK